MSRQLVLRVVGGPFGDLTRADLTRLVYSIDAPQSLTIGRSEVDANVSVPQDARMSSKHLTITFGQGAWRITDLGSRHGTQVAGEQIETAELCDGDLIRAGETTFQVSVSAASTRAGMHVSSTQHHSTATPLAGDPAKSVLLDDMATPPASPYDTAEFVEPIQLVLRIQSGPFGEVEFKNLSRLLNWIGPGQSLVVGRTYQSDIVIRQDKKISSRHFEITCSTTTASLRDLGSSNGTRLNGEKIDEAGLTHGDQISAGDTTFRVSIMGGAQARSSGLRATDVFPVPIRDVRDTVSPDELAEAGSLEPMQVVLNIASGPFNESVREELSRVLNWFGAGQTIVVGRSGPGSEMYIRQDERLSKRHFEVHCDGHRCHLRDLSSVNGTQLNGEFVTEAILRHGDTIRAGRTTFTVNIKGGEPVSDAEVAFGKIKPPSRPQPFEQTDKEQERG